MTDSNMSPYGKKRYYIRLTRQAAEGAMNEWLERGYPCEIRLVRAKRCGMYCVLIVDADPQYDPEAIYFLTWVTTHFPLDYKLEITPLTERGGTATTNKT